MNYLHTALSCFAFSSFLTLSTLSQAAAETKSPLLDLVNVPGGSFLMGQVEGTSEFKSNNDEMPAHTVSVLNFRLSRTEVTFDLWDSCVAEGACSHTPDDQGWGRGNRPVIDVTPKHVDEFIEWISQKTGETFRLPSEAEWEYAARAGTTTLNYWGDKIGKGNANCSNCNRNLLLSETYASNTVEVASYPPNSFGLYDMLGNVAEYTADCWVNKGYKEAPDDGSAVTTKKCRMIIARGGSWLTNANALRISSRTPTWTTAKTSDFGFRLATLPLPPQIYFPINADALNDADQKTLNGHVAVMKANPSLKLMINGHTDNKGSESYNQKLSERRAKNTYDYFISQGIDANRLNYQGLGEGSPIADNNTEEGRAQNRSVRMETPKR